MISHLWRLFKSSVIKFAIFFIFDRRQKRNSCHTKRAKHCKRCLALCLLFGYFITTVCVITHRICPAFSQRIEVHFILPVHYEIDKLKFSCIIFKKILNIAAFTILILLMFKGAFHQPLFFLYHNHLRLCIDHPTVLPVGA